MANKLLNFISVFTIKTKIWQLGVSLSLTSAAALRAAADKLTPFHLTNFSNKLTTQQPTLTPAKKSNTHENLRRRTGRFALTRLQNRPVPPPPAVSFSISLCLLFFLFRRGYCCTVPRPSQRPQNRRLRFVQTFVCCFCEGFLVRQVFRPLQGRLKPSVRNDFGFLPLTCAN